MLVVPMFKEISAMLNRTVSHRRRIGLTSSAGPGRSGFTLVELLTVIAIIVILISVLVPSLGRARIQAKRAASRALLHSISTGLEMFRTESGEYPESVSTAAGTPGATYYGEDTGAWGTRIFGAHKLARALLGPESAQGVVIGSVHPDLLREEALQSSPQFGKFYGNNADPADRIGPYVEAAQPGKQFEATAILAARYGNAPSALQNVTQEAVTFIDTDRYPVLYFKANPRARVMAEAGRTLGPAVYYHEDNLPFFQWPLEGQPHQLECFGNRLVPDDLLSCPPVSGVNAKNSFCYAIHPHSSNEPTGALANLRRPHNADKFLLLTPGPDGVYGTQDDVKNFDE